MQIAGIIAEYNPLHHGHLYHLARTRETLGPGGAVICAMGGNFTQRGTFALLRKQVRAEAAVRSGADLVVELPLPWAVASAERFADGGIQVLAATGVVERLSFGSECGDALRLQRVARELLAPGFPALLKKELTAGDSFPAARQRAAAHLLSGGDAACLAQPNNLLGVEYCKAILRRNLSMEIMTVPRAGMGHHGDGPGEEMASATAIRSALLSGEEGAWALGQMAPAMTSLYESESASGRAPVDLKNAERAMLCRLRSMTEEEFAPLDGGREGLYHRLYEASRTGASLEEICSGAKTKRYAYARLQRMALWAYLGLTPGAWGGEVPYLRVLSANETGRALLRRMRKTASVPILTKPADVRTLGEEARRLFALEARATDLYTLAYPQLSAARGGSEWREGPVIL